MLWAALLLAGIAYSQNGPLVKVAEGVLEGVNESGVKVFKGVPFAAPPVGDLRWKAPQAVMPWEGVRKAVQFGPNPMQENVFGDMNFGTKEMSEDCLYLNIWTPAQTMNEGLPVLIYFNGGGLYAGSGSEPRYAGLSMARKGVISITANYREGIFGFYANSALSKETSYKGSGNYGFMDQVAAITWVKNNIKAFGGDPSRITIVGESAGSMSVSVLMASPLCKGLFAQAMGSSGSVMGYRPMTTLKEAEKVGDEKMKSMGCKNLKELRALSAEELMKRANVKGVPQTNIDGFFLTEQPLATFAKGEQMQIPLLIGWNSYEMAPGFILQGRPATLDNAKAAVAQLFGTHADQVLSLYGIRTDADVDGEKGIMLASDMFIGFSSWRWWNMHNKTTRHPVYRYMYCHARPELLLRDKVPGLAGGLQDKTNDAPATPKYKGAVHSADIEYAMGNLPTNRVYDWQPEDYTVSDQFINYYANFVKTGNPNGLGLVQWDATNGKSVAPVLQLDVQSKLTTDPQLEKRYQFIESLFLTNKPY